MIVVGTWKERQWLISEASIKLIRPGQYTLTALSFHPNNLHLQWLARLGLSISLTAAESLTAE